MATAAAPAPFPAVASGAPRPAGTSSSTGHTSSAPLKRPARPAAETRALGRPGVLSSDGTQYVGLTPARLLDTRPGHTTVDGQGQGGTPSDGGTVRVQITGRGGVPSPTVGAVVLNVTAVDSARAGYVTAYPSDMPLPSSSTLNYNAHRVVANQVTTPLAADGTVALYVASSVDLIVDVEGYFPFGAAGVQPLVPARLLDTRPGGHTIDGTQVGAGPIAGGGQLLLPVVGRGGVPATGVGSVTVNVTVTGATGPGFLTLYPSDLPRPHSSNINYLQGSVVANQATIPVGADGAIAIYAAAAVHVVIDVEGWTAPGFGVHSLASARLLDTRPGHTTVDGQQAGAGAPASGTTILLSVAGRGGVPAEGVSAVVLNLTATGSSQPGYITAFPGDAPAPHASNVNYAAGTTVANAVTVAPDSTGRVALYINTSVDVVADVQGYFLAPAAGSSVAVDVPATTTLLTPPNVQSVDTSGPDVMVTLDPHAPATQVGGHLVVPPVDGLPDGMFGAVTAVTSDAQGRRVVTLEPASIDEMFSSVDLSVSSDTAPQLVSGSAALGVVPGAVARPSGFSALGSAWDCTAHGVPVRLSDVLENGDPPIDISFENSHTIHVFNAGAWFTEPYLLLQLSGEIVTTVQLSVKTSFSCELSATFRRDHRLRVPLGAVAGVPVSFNVEPALSISVDATGRVGLTQRHYYARTIEKRGSDPLTTSTAQSADAPQVVADASMSASVFFGADVSVMFGGGQGSANAQAGMFGTLGPRLTLAFGRSVTPPEACVSLTGRLEAQLGLRLELWAKRWSYTLASLDGPDFANKQWCSLLGGSRTTAVIVGTGDFGDIYPVATLDRALTAAGWQVVRSDRVPSGLAGVGSVWVVDTAALSASDSASLSSYVAGGGGLYLTGERGCCEDLNAWDQALLTQVVPGASLELGQAGHDFFGPFTPGPLMSGPLGTSPAVVAGFEPDGPGKIAGVDDADVMWRAEDGTPVAAAWSGTDVSGSGGHVVLVMDINWLNDSSADWSTTGSPQVQDIALYLSGLASPPAARRGSLATAPVSRPHGPHASMAP